MPLVRRAPLGLAALFALLFAVVGVLPVAAQDGKPTLVVTTPSATIDGNLRDVQALQAEPGRDGAISLREAVAVANGTGGFLTIRFAPALKGQQILLPAPAPDASALEIRVPSVTIDGDVDGDGRPDVMLQGFNFEWFSADPNTPTVAARNTLALSSRDGLITNLAITGLHIGGPTAVDNRVAGNLIGLDLTGEPRGLASDGVTIADEAHRNVVHSNVIGGNTVPSRAGSARGVVIARLAAGNAVTGNWIGVRRDGGAVPNDAGVVVTGGAKDNVIGGDRAAQECTGPCNVISANRHSGVLIGGSGSSGNKVRGNYIGTTPDGTGARPNATAGRANGAVWVTDGASENVIGGSRDGVACTGPCNLISGNAANGVRIGESVHTVGELQATTKNVVAGNYVGTALGGDEDLANAGSGVYIVDSSSTVVGSKVPAGGDCVRSCNLIRGNWGDGVDIHPGLESYQHANGNTVRGNSIGGNGGLGIDLRGDDVAYSVTPNRPHDFCPPADSCRVGNGGMAFPAGVTASHDPKSDTTTISGWLDNPAAGTVIDVYASPTRDRSGFGEGWRYLGHATPAGDGAWSLAISGKLPAEQRFVSATATSAGGSTSEFSAVCRDPDGDGRSDSDGDSLCDEWETTGVDYDGDGDSDLRMPGARWNRPDVFVETDHLQGARVPLDSHQLPEDAYLALQSAFANAPVRAVSGGPTGIGLHLDWGEAVPEEGFEKPDDAAFFDPDPAGPDLGDVKFGVSRDPCTSPDARLGWSWERGDPNCSNILGARRLVFHYALSMHDWKSGAAGRAEYKGNDFILKTGAAHGDAGTYALAAGDEGNSLESPWLREYADWNAGVFMHELGHNLGLLHSGDGDEPNCEPNYFSVMNYSYVWNIFGLDASFRTNTLTRTDRAVDFSRNGARALNEAQLDEESGVQGPWSVLFTKGSGGRAQRYVALPGYTTATGARTPGSIDWNVDGVLGKVSGIDVNAGHGDSCTGSGVEHSDHDDWKNLVYDFRANRNQYSDAAVAAPTDLGIVGDEPTEDDYLLGLGHDPDADGVGTLADNCPVIANPGQQDGNSDGIGDACSVTEAAVPSQLAPGQTASVTVTLGAPAPDGAFVEAASDEPALVRVPRRVSVPAGATGVAFPVEVSPYSGAITTQLALRYGAHQVFRPVAINVNLNSPEKRDFGGDGVVTTNFGLSLSEDHDSGWDVAVQRDGKVLVAGGTKTEHCAPLGSCNDQEDFAVARYLPNGELDSSFGGDGKVTVDFSPSDFWIYNEAFGVAVQPDGRIVLGGDSGGNIALVRLDPNGELDLTFGSGGRAQLNLGKYESARDVALDAQGRIVTTGQSGFSGSDVVVARFSAAGVPDATFGSGGAATTNLGGSEGGAAVAVDGAGRYVVVGRDREGTGRQLILRYDASGALDNSFGSAGVVRRDLGGVSGADGLAVQADGRIVVVGYGAGGGVLSRYRSDGSFDREFNGGSDVVAEGGRWNGVALLADGRIAVAGNAAPGSGDFAVGVYRGNGEPDTRYGPAGIATTDVAGFDGGRAHAVASYLDGGFVAAGRVGDFGATDFAVARYVPDPGTGGGGAGSVPEVSLADATVQEGDEGATDAKLVVSLSRPVEWEVTVEAAVASGTANPVDDFRPLTETVSIPAGSTQASIPVVVVGDEIDEPDETVNVSLTNPRNSQFGRSEAVLTIRDDDRRATALNLDDKVVAYSDPAEVTAKLTEVAANQPVAGAAVSLSFGGPAETRTTDANGSVRTSVVMTQTSGVRVAAQATFAGDGERAPTRGEGSVVIGKEDCTLTYTGPTTVAAGSSVQLSAAFGETDSHPGNWANKSVVFRLTGTSGAVSEVTATTDAAGRATAPVAIGADVYGLAVVFSGDSHYDPCEGSAPEPIIVGEPGGAKVTGGGWWGETGARTNIGLVLTPAGNGTWKGQLQLRARKPDLIFHSNSVVSAAVNGSTVSWVGRGRCNRDVACEIEITVTDNGPPRRPPSTDLVSIVVRETDTRTVRYTTNGSVSLRGGNIKVHP